MTYPPQTPPFLVMAQGPWPKHTFPLNKNILSIGRMDDNDIVIDDPGVSRYHARLTRSEGKWILEDLGSSNGTFINGQRIRVPTYLAADSQIGLGPDVLLGVQRGTPAAARPRQKAPRKKSKLPIVGGVLGLGLAGLIVLAVLAVAGYFYFSPAARLPFGLSQTTDENIFACGDCTIKKSFFTGKTSNLKLASIATMESRVAGANLFKIKRKQEGAIGVFSTIVDKTVFAVAGLGEKQARDIGYNVVTGEIEKPNRHPGKMPGMSNIKLKLVFNKDNGELLGGTARGSDSAGEMINTVSACIQKKMTADDIAQFQLGTHPAVTTSPIAYQLVNAAELAIQKLS